LTLTRATRSCATISKHVRLRTLGTSERAGETLVSCAHLACFCSHARHLFTRSPENSLPGTPLSSSFPSI
ncbi:hypothetical protein S83_048315, partial [Arachis hypogaea]